MPHGGLKRSKCRSRKRENPYRYESVSLLGRLHYRPMDSRRYTGLPSAMDEPRIPSFSSGPTTTATWSSPMTWTSEPSWRLTRAMLGRTSGTTSGRSLRKGVVSAFARSLGTRSLPHSIGISIDPPRPLGSSSPQSIKQCPSLKKHPSAIPSFGVTFVACLSDDSPTPCTTKYFPRRSA